MAEVKQLKVTLKKSLIGTPKVHRDCVKSLGLRRINHQVTLLDNASIRGMVNKVHYLVQVEEV
jgi:large subunit ribosomal protein L30